MNGITINCQKRECVVDRKKKTSRFDLGIMEVTSKTKRKINELVIVADDKIYETENSRCIITEKAAFLKLTTY